jgi:prolyl oligopeptidase
MPQVRHATAAAFARVDVPAPLPARPVVDTYWGVSVEDPFRLLEDTTDPEVQCWMRAQVDATATLLSRTPAAAHTSRGSRRSTPPHPR